MFATRLFQILLLFTAVTYAADPAVWDHGLKGLVVRASSSGDAAAPTSVEESSPAQDTASPTTDSKPTTTEKPPETTTEPEKTTDKVTSQPPSTTSQENKPTTTNADPTTSSPPETSDAPTTSPPESSDAATTSAPVNDSTSSEPENTTQADGTTSAQTTPTPVVSTSFQTITMTNSDGSQQVTTSASVTTTTPDLNESEGGSSGGMDTKTRNTIIGVVVGIGGAILLGALGVVAWRIRSRKKRAEENDGLMEYNGGYSGIDKAEPVSASLPPPVASSQAGRSPFQSTLENYHQPSQPVNASSNF